MLARALAGYPAQWRKGMESTTRISVSSDKAELVRDIAQYPQALLQWFADVIFNYAGIDHAQRGKADHLENPEVRLEIVLNLFRRMAGPDVADALLEAWQAEWNKAETPAPAE